MTPLKKAMMLLSVVLLTPPAQAGARLSLIEGSPKLGSETDPNRIIPFVELIDEGGRKREYSVPFVNSLQTKEVVADQTTTWKTLQDTMHWALQVGVNNDITSTPIPGMTYSARFLNCDVQVTADIEIEAGHTLADRTWITRPKSKDLGPLLLSNPETKAKKKVNNPLVVEGWGNDNVNLSGSAVPLVKRDRYCKYSKTDMVPDELEGVFTPSIIECTPIGCVQTAHFPLPEKVDYQKIADRLTKVCDDANPKESNEYQKTNLTSITKNLPLAIHWDGVMTPSIDNLRSGTTMAPVTDVMDYKEQAKSLEAIVNADARNALYLPGFLPSLFPEMKFEKGSPGMIELEQYKRYLLPTAIPAMEKAGYANFFQTWQSVDTVTDYRPIIYWAHSYACFLMACTAVPIPIPVPSGLITSSLIAKKCIFTPAIPTGTTLFTATRFHWASISIPEGYPVPNTSNSPILRPGNE